VWIAAERDDASSVSSYKLKVQRPTGGVRNGQKAGASVPRMTNTDAISVDDPRINVLL